MISMIQSVPWLIMDWLADIATGVIWVGIWLSSGMYKVAMTVFELFIILANGKLVEPSDFKVMIENMYLIIGVVMLFVIAFFLLKAMINPDDQSKSTSGIKKIITNLITSSLILAVLPTIFTFMFDFQDSFITEYNVIGKFFGFGDLQQSPISGTPAERVRQGSYKLVNGVYTAFLNIDSESCPTDPNGASDVSSAIKTCQESIQADTHNFADAIASVNTSGKISTYYQFAENANRLSDEAGAKLDFDFLMCLVGGFLLVYIGINYCFDMALRLVKLVFYQAIAPIPILLRIVPEGKLSGIFNQWMKITFTCYFEVYIRIFVFYFVIYLSDKLTQPGSFLETNVFQYGAFMGFLAKAFTFMGLIMFMKQAPKLIGEVTGMDSGNMKLGIRDKLADGGAFAVGALAGGAISSGMKNLVNSGQNVRNKYQESRNAGDGVLKSAFKSTGAAARGVGSVVAGAVSGGVRGGYGAKNAKNFTDMKNAATSGASTAVDKRNKRAAYKASHGDTFFGAVGGHLKDFGKSTERFFTDESIEGLTRESNSMGKIVSKYNTFNDTIEQLLEKEQAKGGGSVFLANGYDMLTSYKAAYDAFDLAAQKRAEAKAAFNSGGKIDYTDSNGVQHHNAVVDATVLRDIEGQYISARDNARDELMDITLKGSKSAEYAGLNAKGQAALKDSLVNVESLQATILENANSKVVQKIMGEKGNGALKDIMNNKPLTTKSFVHNKSKLKDEAKVAQGQADIKIAELNKEQAAKGDKK